MKFMTARIVSLLAIMGAISASSLATASTMGVNNHAHVSSASVALHSANGTVKKVDVSKGVVTFAHGPIPNLGWPAMTMNFSVSDKGLFEKLKVGKQVVLKFQQHGADNVVVSVE